MIGTLLDPPVLVSGRDCDWLLSSCDQETGL